MNNETYGLNDPEGWTFEDNPHRYPKYGGMVIDYFDKKDWRNWFEWIEDDYGELYHICHGCIRRAEFSNGNCRDGGEYWLCVRKGWREERRKEFNKILDGVKVKKNVQSTLI